MIQVIAIIGLMLFMWAVAVYATYKEEPKEEIQVSSHSDKAA
jgi:hypothetical protein